MSDVQDCYKFIGSVLNEMQLFIWNTCILNNLMQTLPAPDKQIDWMIQSCWALSLPVVDTLWPLQMALQKGTELCTSGPERPERTSAQWWGKDRLVVTMN